MKNLLLSAFFLTFTLVSFSQTDVTLTINHKLGSENFAFNSPTVNNLGDDFNVTRLDYYISNIVLTHDGGTKTSIDDTWILVDASRATVVTLGNYDVTNLESIELSMGVDPDHNHTDPATYPENHPLAPVFPSMHWGWSAGYRFIAFEGNGGPNLDQTIQVHALDDINYHQTSCAMSMTAMNSQLDIELDADYTRLLENMVLTSGVYEHGRNFEAKQILENARDFTFTAASGTSSLTQPDHISAFDVFPNPTNNGIVTVKLMTSDYSNFTVSVKDLLGKHVAVSNQEIVGQFIQFQLPNKGVYLMELNQHGKAIMTRTVLSK